MALVLDLTGKSQCKKLQNKVSLKAEQSAFFLCYHIFMTNYIHVLIHHKRIEKGWSLESLSHGICSLSYLAKVEKGTITPALDICNKLLERLDVHLEDDVKDILPKVDYFYHHFYDYDVYLTEEELTKLSNSIYLLDAIIIRAYQTGNQIDELKDYEPFFTHEQKKKYYQILVHHNKLDYHELLYLFPDIDSYSIIANTLYLQGEYAKAIPFFIAYYDAAAKNCDIDNMIYAKMSLGSVYACLFDINTCIEEYNQAIKLIDRTHSSNYKEVIYYNIGATYTELKQYDKALEYLSKTKMKDMLYYHKLAICYEKTGKYKKALAAISKGKEFNSEHSYLLDIVEYRLLHKDYIHDIEYEKLLCDTLECVRNELPHGFLAMQENDLLEYYEENRRYKDAYILLKKQMQK